MQFLELNWFESGLRYIMAWLCSFIYPLISLVYNLFRYVSQVNILSSDTVQPIYQRVTMILTIVMVFYITFEFVKYVVQPDGITDKEKGAGKLVYKMIAVVVLIAFVPTIFTYAFKFQNVIVDKDIIGKVILGNNNNVSDNYGGEFSESIFKLFYQISEEGDGATCGDMPCRAIVSANYTALRNNNSLPYITTGLNESYEKEEQSFGEKIIVNKPYIEFNGLFAVVVGGLIAYILILYCVDVGARWAQLVFLQVIAPIPIIGFLSPKKDGIFQKWYKQCLTTYLDLFIRIAIINFVLLISRILLNGLESNDLFTELSGISGFMKTLVIIVLILGLMIFAQKAPKLLGELFPKMGAAAGNFGISGKDRFEPTVKTIKGAANTIAKPVRAGKRVSGAVTGAAIGIGSAIKQHKNIAANNKNGFTRGLSTAYSAVKAATAGIKAGASKGGNVRQANAAARQSIQKDISVADKGGTIIGHDMLGGYYQGKSADNKRTIEIHQTRQKAKENVASSLKEMKVMKTANSYVEDWNQQGTGSVAARNSAKKAIEKASRVYSVGARDAAAQAIFENNIKMALDTVYGTDTVSRDRALAEFKANMEIGSANWDAVKSEIIEAKRVSEGAKYGPKDANGNYTKTVEHSDDKTIEQSNLETFAKEIGDVADAAREQETEFKYSEDVRKAEANANSEAPGGKK